MINRQLPPNEAIRSDRRWPKVSFCLELFTEVAGKDLVLLQTFDDFVIERGKFADLVLEHVFDIFLSELAEIVQADKALCRPTRACVS